jgi:uncharacterized glyoxalase superfamily protein PhnB
MTANRSVPDATVIPVLAYDDVADAVAWLVRAFGFRERLRIGDHRAQLTFGRGAIVVVARQGGRSAADGTRSEVLVRVPDADAHHARAQAAGARILQPPTDHPYGERQYVAQDPAGHTWTFSESIADVDPAAWGGILRPSD